VQGEGQALIQKVAAFDTTPVMSVDSEQEALAVANLWAWYLEWSGIARTVIKDRRVLKSLGFLRTKSGSTEETEAEPEPEGDIGTEDTAEVPAQRAV
jgi:hypothetical protein